MIAAVFGEPDLSGVGTFTINNAEFSVGLILDPALNFVLIATAVFFLVVLPLNRLSARLSGGPEPESEDTVLLREIRDLLSQQQQQQIDQR